MRPKAGRPLNPHVGDPWCQQKLWLCPESDHLSPVQGVGGLFRGAVCPPLEMCPQQLDGHSAGSVQRSSPNRPWAGLGWGPRSSASLTPTARSRRVPHSCARCPVMRSAPRVGVSCDRCSAGARARAPSLFLGRAALSSAVTRSCEITEQEAGPGRAQGPGCHGRLPPKRPWSPPVSHTGKGPVVSRLPTHNELVYLFGGGDFVFRVVVGSREG